MKYLFCEVETNNISPFEELLDIERYGRVESVITSGREGFEVPNNNILDLSFSKWIVKIFIAENFNIKGFVDYLTTLSKNIDIKIGNIEILEDNNNYLQGEEEKVIKVKKFLIYNTLGLYHEHLKSSEQGLNQGFYPMFINQGMAFGTGSHETTVLCLEFLDTLASNGFCPRNALDIGTGSAILAIAMAKRFNCQILATDIDDKALYKAKELIKLNNEESNIETSLSDGFKGINKGARFSLITANILLNPLIEMRKDFYEALDNYGFIILSGILENQVYDLVKAYKEVGFEALIVKKLNEWASVAFIKDSNKKILKRDQ